MEIFGESFPKIPGIHLIYDFQRKGMEKLYMLLHKYAAYMWQTIQNTNKSTVLSGIVSITWTLVGPIPNPNFMDRLFIGLVLLVETLQRHGKSNAFISDLEPLLRFTLDKDAAMC